MPPMPEQTETTLDQSIEDDASTDEDVVRFKRAYFYIALVPVAFVVGLAVGYLFWGRIDPDASQPTQVAAAAQAGDPDPQAQPAPEDLRFEVNLDDDPALGPADAPIVIVEFSDFNCPFCQRFHIDTFGGLIERYPDQIRFIYRDFPVVGGFEAALASECADAQDAYWEYHNLLFTGGGEPGKETYLSYAAELGLDEAAFEACFDSQEFADEVESDARYAASLGITGTPTFFINGIPLVGAQPLQTFLDIIESELAG